MQDDVIDKYHKQKIEEEMKNIAKGFVNSVEEVIDEHNHGKVVKTVPMKPEWIAMLAELQHMGEVIIPEIRRMKLTMDEVKAKRNFLWSSISIGLNDYRDMHITETNDIEIYEN